MNPIYLSAAALTVAAAFVFLFMVFQLIRAGKRGDEVDEAHGAPEGAITDFYFDPEKDGGDRK